MYRFVGCNIGPMSYILMTHKQSEQKEHVVNSDQAEVSGNSNQCCKQATPSERLYRADSAEKAILALKKVILDLRTTEDRLLIAKSLLLDLVSAIKGVGQATALKTAIEIANIFAATEVFFEQEDQLNPSPGEAYPRKPSVP